MVKFINDIKNVSKYTTIEKHGEGSMGIAYKLTDNKGNIIIKKTYKDMVKGDYRYERRHDNFKNEVKILKKLYGEKHIPKLLYYDIKKHEIYMTECGVRISKDNCPKNWKKQLIEILKIFKKHNIAHNSTAINNTCVKDDIIYFIDFASSGAYRPRKRNQTDKIINDAKNLHDAYNSKKTRDPSKNYPFENLDNNNRKKDKRVKKDKKDKKESKTNQIDTNNNSRVVHRYVQGNHRGATRTVIH